MRRGTAVGVVLVFAAAAAFAYLNGSERVTLQLGFATLYRVSLPVLIFAALILGMVVMLLTGVATDRRVREILRERLQEEAREEERYVDPAQRDLFSSSFPHLDPDRPGRVSGPGPEAETGLDDEASGQEEEAPGVPRSTMGGDAM